MTSKRFGYILIPTLVVCFFTTLLTATAKFSYRHPTGERFTVTRDGTILQRPAAADEPTPQAATDETEFDFGLMNPLTMGSHSFVIRNQGDLPLKLQAGATTCKCTLSDVSEEPIPPGGEGQVTVQWNTGRKNRFYAHEASVYTNDPSQKVLRFSVKGIVRVQMAVEPPEAIFERIAPDSSASQRLLVYSQVWDDLEIADVQSSLAGLTWEIEPADAETLAAHEALSASWLRITTPRDLSEGTFSEWLQFRAVPASAPDEAVDHQLAVVGKTLKRLAIYGPEIDAQGVVSLGSVSRGTGLKKRLLMKVRDDETNLTVKHIETTPEFLDVRVVPGKTGSANGLMYLELEIPPGAPRSDFLAAIPAKIRIEFDHPRIVELKLTARFAVVD